jgi:hypothetical protein
MWEAYHKYFHTYLAACRSTYSATFGSARSLAGVEPLTLQQRGARGGGDAAAVADGSGAGEGHVDPAHVGVVEPGPSPTGPPALSRASSDDDSGASGSGMKSFGVVTALKDALGLFVAFKRMWNGRDKVKVCAR